MKLIDFQIKNYKVIDDTRPIRVDGLDPIMRSYALNAKGNLDGR